MNLKESPTHKKVKEKKGIKRYFRGTNKRWLNLKEALNNIFIKILSILSLKTLELKNVYFLS